MILRKLDKVYKRIKQEINSLIKIRNKVSKIINIRNKLYKSKTCGLVLIRNCIDFLNKNHLSLLKRTL